MSEDHPFPEFGSSPTVSCSTVADSTASEHGFLGRILDEESSGLDTPLSIWAGAGGYGKAPGVAREDQVCVQGQPCVAS